MPTDLDLFAAAEIKMRYREPFLTAGLNEKQAVNRPPGTYRGFRLGIGGGDNVVTATADVTNSDHVAVYETGSGFSLALRKTGGDFNLDLSGLVDVVDKTWVLCIFADYAIGVTTSAVIRAYELSPVDEFTIAPENPELIVLGTVFIEANNADPFLASEVNHDFRRMAWMVETVDSVTWQPLVRNGGFELSYDNSSGAFDRASAHWRRFSSSPSDAEWKTNDTDPRTGRVALEWNSLATATIVNGLASQELRCPVVAGQLFKFQFYKKNLLVPTAGSQVFRLQWKNNVGDDVGSSSFTIDTSGVDGSYVKVEGVVAAITGAFFLHSVEFVASSVSYGAIASAILFDDVQVWAEGFALDTGPQNDVRGSGIPDLAGSSVVLYPPNFNFMATSTKALVLLENGGNARGQDSKGSLRILDAEGRAQAIEQPLTGSTDTYTLLHEAWTYATSDSGVREYVTPGGELHRTVNAKFSNTSGMWTKDDNGTKAMRVVYASTGMRLDSQEANVNTWADAAWTRTVFEINGFNTTDDEIVSQSMPPSLRITDEDGNAKFVVDHQGFLVREHMEFFEDWNRQDTQYTMSIPTGGSVQNDEDVLALGVDMTSPFLQIVNGGNAVERNSISDKGPTLFANMQCTLEFWLAMDDAGDTNDMNVRMGVNRLTDFWGNFGIAFEKKEADTNWFARAESPADGLTRVDLGVPPVTDTGQKFRLELYKGTAPGGARALFFIDGILLHSMDIASVVPQWGVGSVDEQEWGMGIQGIAATTNSIFIGLVHMVWHVIDGDYGIRDS